MDENEVSGLGLGIEISQQTRNIENFQMQDFIQETFLCKTLYLKIFYDSSLLRYFQFQDLSQKLRSHR
jgi:hypothetical protein